MPEIFFYTCHSVDFLCQRKEVITEPVDVGDEQGADGGLLGNGVDEAFGTAADGAADMGLGGSGRASGEDESAPGGEAFLCGIHSVLDPLDIGLADAGAARTEVIGGRGELGADDEELVLDGEQRLPVGGVGEEGEGAVVSSEDIADEEKAA